MAVGIDRDLVATDDPLQADLVTQMDRQVGQLDVDTNQFTTILMKLPARTARSFKEEWMNDEFLPKNTALAATAASGDTEVTVTASEGWYGKVGDVGLFCQTGEHFRITGVSASAWTVVRSIGDTAAATAATGTAQGGIIIVAGSNSQGGTLPTAVITEKVADYNYTQNVRNSYRFTAEEEFSEHYSGNPIAYHRRKIGVEHRRELEQIAFFGGRSYTSDGGNGKPRHTAGGIEQYVTASDSAAGALDKGEFADFLREAMQYGDRNRKVFFCAPLVAQVLSEYLQDNWVRAKPDENVWGVKVDAVIDPAFTGNRIPVFVKGDWMRLGEGNNPSRGSRGYLLDMSQIELFRGPSTTNGSRWMTLYRKRQDVSADEVAEEFLSTVTFKVKTPRAHRILTNVSG